MLFLSRKSVTAWLAAADSAAASLACLLRFPTLRVDSELKRCSLTITSASAVALATERASSGFSPVPTTSMTNPEGWPAASPSVEPSWLADTPAWTAWIAPSRASGSLQNPWLTNDLAHLYPRPRPLTIEERNPLDFFG